MQVEQYTGWSLMHDDEHGPLSHTGLNNPITFQHSEGFQLPCENLSLSLEPDWHRTDDSARLSQMPNVMRYDQKCLVHALH